MSFLTVANEQPFTVHQTIQAGMILVYVVANWPNGADTSMSMLEIFPEDAELQAGGYAAALADAHGSCAVVHS